MGRGEFIGKKTYVKLPLWSAAINQYVLREMPASVFRTKDKQQPKGWLVDFSSRSILVDFEGARSKVKALNKTLDEEVATEMLISRPDGKLQVLRSDADMSDPNRVKLEGEWKKWVESVKSRKVLRSSTFVRLRYGAYAGCAAAWPASAGPAAAAMTRRIGVVVRRPIVELQRRAHGRAATTIGLRRDIRPECKRGAAGRS